MKPLSITKVGVVGAGTMGTGIAICFVNAGFELTLVETTQVALDRGLAVIQDYYNASVTKGRFTTEQVKQRMTLLTGSLDYQSLADADLVIEAVFESMSLKKKVCARLGEVCKTGAIIASNTSTLDVDQLALATGRPQDVVGTHFFSPAHVMRLLEVVRGAQTSPAVLETVMELALKIGKTAVVSGVCYGFIGNRMAEVYMRETEFLLLEGASPTQIDAAIEALGMAMGPCRMLDLAGIDVGAKTVIEYDKVGGLPPDKSYRILVRKLFELGRFGQKTGAGYYRYEGRQAIEDSEITLIARALGDANGIAPRKDISPEEIVERLMYPLINEGFKILEEGIASRAGDIDLVWTAGFGFPQNKGGPMAMADSLGLAKVVTGIEHYATTRGNLYHYWTPSPLLISLASEGKRISDFKVEQS
jgi:3-hydroxyacyl-CoA dehydrogenase